MQVHVEVERASEALYHGHRARPGTAGARQVGSPDQIGLDGAENYRETARERLGLGCKQKPERVREAEYPPADRYVREYVIDEMRRRLDHASSTAARAEAAALAGEGDQVLVAAAVALHTNEAVFQATARQIVLELALDEPGRRSFT